MDWFLGSSPAERNSPLSLALAKRSTHCELTSPHSGPDDRLLCEDRFLLLISFHRPLLLGQCDEEREKVRIRTHSLLAVHIAGQNQKLICTSPMLSRTKMNFFLIARRRFAPPALGAHRRMYHNVCSCLARLPPLGSTKLVLVLVLAFREPTGSQLNDNRNDETDCSMTGWLLKIQFQLRIHSLSLSKCSLITEPNTGLSKRLSSMAEKFSVRTREEEPEKEKEEPICARIDDAYEMVVDGTMRPE